MPKVIVSNNKITHNDGSDRFQLTFDYNNTIANEETATVKGNFVPSVDNVYQLGTGDNRWQHIYQGPGSIYMGDDSLLTVVNNKMIIRNRKDGNLYPPPLWHQKHALFKYGINISVQQDDVSFKIRNYIGTRVYSEQISSFVDSATDLLTIKNDSATAEDEESDYYKDWNIHTFGTVGGTSATPIYGKVTAYDESTLKLSVMYWFSDSAYTTGVTVTAIDTDALFELKSPAAYGSRLQTRMDQGLVAGTITTVTSQSAFILSASSGILSTIDDTYNKVYVLRVVNGGNVYYAKPLTWVGSTSSITIVSSNAWYKDISLNLLAIQPTITTSDTFTLINRKTRLVDLNIENILNIIETDIPNAQDYKKYNSFGDELDTDTYTSFTTGTSAIKPWDDGYLYDTSGNIISSYDSDNDVYKAGTAIDIYTGSFDLAAGFVAMEEGTSSFLNIGVTQSSISTGTRNTTQIIIPSNDSNAFSISDDYTNYEFQLKDTNGNIDYHTVVSSTTATISSTVHIKLTVGWPFVSQPTASHKYILRKPVDSAIEVGGDSGYSNSNQSLNITSLNYQIKLDDDAIKVTDYYDNYKIIVDVYDGDTGNVTSIYGIISAYNKDTKVVTIDGPFTSGIKWANVSDDLQASLTPGTAGYDYYLLEKSGGASTYQSNYYQAGNIVYDPIKAYQDVDYSSQEVAVAAGMDPQMYKMMKTIQADPDALDFDEFDASRSVAYNWTDYFYDNETWFSTTDSTYLNKNCIIGTSTPPTGAQYCKLSIIGSSKSNAILSVPSTTLNNNIKRITSTFDDTGYIFSKGLYIGNQDLSSTALRPSDLLLSDGGLVVKGSSSFDGGVLINNTMTLSSGQITDTSGQISFDNENIITTGIMTAVQFSMNSDRNLKQNITELQDEYKNLLQLKPVSFNWKDDFKKDNTLHYGFIAQEVQNVFPNLVEEREHKETTEPEKPNLLYVNYVEVIPLLVSYIQKQQSVIDGILTHLNLQ